MAVRTRKQFLEGLRDGREVWLEGERAADVASRANDALSTFMDQCRNESPTGEASNG